MFCLSKRSNGFYYIYYDAAGKRTCISTKTKFKADANKFLSDFKEEIKKRNEQKLISLPLSKFISEFIDFSKTIHTAKTVKAYNQSLNFLEKYFGDVLLSDITNSKVIKYFENRIKTSSIYQARKDLICFSSCFNYAVKQKYILENPCKGIKRFKIPEKQPMFFSETDFEILLRIIDNPDIKDLVIFAVNTGLREGELLTLTWNQIDFKNKFLILDNQQHITKSKRVRSIPLNIKAMQILTERQIKRNNGEFVFTFNGKALTPDYIARRFKAYVIKAGLNSKLNFHSLRSTFASWLIQKGVSITNVSKILGHSSVRVTEAHYAFLRPVDLIESVNILNN